MSTFLECIVDICLPIAGRWIIIQIASLFGTDLNTSTILWFVTILCAFIAENFTFHPKKKWSHKSTEEAEFVEVPTDEENPKGPKKGPKVEIKL